MSDSVKAELSVEEAAAKALADPRRLEAVAKPVNAMVRSAPSSDPLIVLLEQTAAQAQQLGLTAEDVEAELEAYNAERRG